MFLTPYFHLTQRNRWTHAQESKKENHYLRNTAEYLCFTLLSRVEMIESIINNHVVARKVLWDFVHEILFMFSILLAIFFSHVFFWWFMIFMIFILIICEFLGVHYPSYCFSSSIHHVSLGKLFVLMESCQ